MPPKEFNTSLIINLSEDFSRSFPGASVGLLSFELMESFDNPDLIQKLANDVIFGLKDEFSDPTTLGTHPIIDSYDRYYKKFRKTYHVLAQVESVVFKDKPIRASSPILQLIFTAELKNMLLTAIHDLDSIQPPLEIGIASGEESYTTLSGKEQRLKSGDMFMRDQLCVISSVIYGPDQRTRFKPFSNKILIVVYAPTGIGRNAVSSHFDDIKTYLRLISPQLIVKLEEIYPLH